MSQELRTTRRNKSYKLEPYNPQWAADFADLKAWYEQNIAGYHIENG